MPPLVGVLVVPVVPPLLVDVPVDVLVDGLVLVPVDVPVELEVCVAVDPPHAAVIIRARFQVVASISAPAGVCATNPATAATDMTMPMLASSHFWIVSR